MTEKLARLAQYLRALNSHRWMVAGTCAVCILLITASLLIITGLTSRQPASVSIAVATVAPTQTPTLTPLPTPTRLPTATTVKQPVSIVTAPPPPSIPTAPPTPPTPTAQICPTATAFPTATAT